MTIYFFWTFWSGLKFSTYFFYILKNNNEFSQLKDEM